MYNQEDHDDEFLTLQMADNAQLTYGWILDYGDCISVFSKSTCFSEGRPGMDAYMYAYTGVNKTAYEKQKKMVKSSPALEFK